MSPAAEGAPGVGGERLRVCLDAVLQQTQSAGPTVSHVVLPLAVADDIARMLERAAAPGPDRGEVERLRAEMDSVHRTLAPRFVRLLRIARWLRAENERVLDELGDARQANRAVMADLRRALLCLERRPDFPDPVSLAAAHVDLDATRIKLAAAEARASGLERERDEADRNYRMALSDMRRGGLCRSIYPETTLGESLAAAHGDLDAMRGRAERAERVAEQLRADLKLAAEYAGTAECEGCGAPIMDCEDAKHTGDVHGCTPYVHEGSPGACWRYRTADGMDRAWPACALAEAIGDPAAPMHHSQFATDVAEPSDLGAKPSDLGAEPSELAAGRATASGIALDFDAEYGPPKRGIVVGTAGGNDRRLFVYGETARDLRGLPSTYKGCEVVIQVAGRARALTDKEPT